MSPTHTEFPGTHYHPYPGLVVPGIPNPILGWEFLALCLEHAPEGMALCQCEKPLEFLCDQPKGNLRDCDD